MTKAKSGAPASPFPLAKGSARGYQPLAVDAFLQGVRTSYEQRDGGVRSVNIREASFPLVKRGYDITAVDRALTRLEDAFAVREREEAIAAAGAEAWLATTREGAQEILDRVGRKRRRRFTRTSRLTFGYRIDEVDAVTDRIAHFLRSGEALSAEQVRQAAFRMQRGGYREEQVDALLDATVEVILAVR